MKLKKLSILFLAAGLTLQSCRKEENPFRTVDQEPFHWSATKADINGKAWGDCIVSVFTGINSEKSSAADYQGQRFTISARDFCTDHDGVDTTINDLYLNISEPIEEGKTYQLNGENYGGVAGWLEDWKRFFAETSRDSEGELHISKFEKGRISGTFSYVARIDSLDMTLKVENGTFEDVRILNF